MKLISCIFLSLFCLSVTAQRSLIVKRGQTKKITVPIRSLLLDTLILEDNARLEVDTAVLGMSIIAKYVIIGFNVVIDASPENILPSGVNGNNGSPASGYCREAGMGAMGTPGSNGPDAADVFLYLRIRSIGSLNIDAHGSNGSPGGNGGNGGAGANGDPNAFSGCKAKAGGRGGNGGMGGSGATVMLNYTFIDPSGNFLSSQPQLNEANADVKGGSGGAGGLAGQKGAAGRKTNGLIDPMLNQNVPNALNGVNGANGKDGRLIKVAIKQNL